MVPAQNRDFLRGPRLFGPLNGTSDSEGHLRGPGAGTRFLITKFLITKFLTHKVPNNEIPNYKIPKYQSS